MTGSLSCRERRGQYDRDRERVRNINTRTDKLQEQHIPLATGQPFEKAFGKLARRKTINNSTKSFRRKNKKF